ncbi:MAG: hypothetical protein ABH812_03615 [bacterium]
MGKEYGVRSESPNGHVKRVRAKDEVALQTRFGAQKVKIPLEFVEQLSTQPDLVGPSVNSESLLCQCNHFSVELSAGLIDIEIDAKVVVSNKSLHPFKSIHIYITVGEGNKEVVIGPIIGQFLLGYNHVFVGSRKQLKQLMIDYFQKGTQSYRRLYTTNSPLEYFETIWGSCSRLRYE